MTESPLPPDPQEASQAALRSRIRDLGDEVDGRRAATAGAIGGAVFIGLLGLGGLYDLWRGKGAVWASLGVSASLFRAIVILTVLLSFALAALGLARHHYGDKSREARLADLESELASLYEDSEK